MSYCLYFLIPIARQSYDIQNIRNPTFPQFEYIVKIFKEIVSGDSISTRPQMQILLAEVEQSIYDGVLVVDIDRLARGDTIDQGIVAQTFKYSIALSTMPSGVLPYFSKILALSEP